MDINVRVNEQGRARALGLLQRHFGLNCQGDRDQVEALKPAIFTDTAISSCPSGHEPVQGYRHFIIRVQVLEHAFNTSYSLEFVYTSSKGEVQSVGSVTVLGKGDATTQCAGCIGRRNEQSKIKGVIQVPTHIIADIICKEGANNSNVTTDVCIDAVKKNIRAKMITAAGHEIAVASPTSGAGGGAEVKGLRREAIPEIEFASANVAHPKGEAENGAFTFYDYTRHCDLLSPSCWVPPA